MDSRKVPAVIPESHLCTYTACYCEENVWKLCEFVYNSCPSEELSKCYCVFISNKAKKVPVWFQKAGQEENKLVIWDYHVIFVYVDTDQTLVYDLDTELSFPCSFIDYMAACIGDETMLRDEYKRMFRVNTAAELLATFASDRSHMIDSDGLWQSPPPAYPPIKTRDCSNNLHEFINMDRGKGHGVVCDLKEFQHRFNVKTVI